MIRTISAASAALILILASAGSAVAEDKPWTGEVSAALTAQTGTNDTIAGTLDATGNRVIDSNEIGVRANASYGTTRSRPVGKNETTQNSQAIFADHKYVVNQGLFVDSGLEVSRDSVQDREVRVAVNTGPGYRVWKGEDPSKSRFDVNVGVGYRYELYNVTTTPIVDRDNYDEDHFADVLIAFEYKNMLFDDKIEVTHTGSAKMPANDPKAFVLASEFILGVPLTEVWSLRASFLVEYLNVQPRFVQNTTTRSTLGLGYKF